MSMQQILCAVANCFEANVGRLNELDAIMGDGEHGSNMKKCFTAVRDALPGWQGQGELDVLSSAGMKLLSAGGGTATTLLGFFAIKAAGAAKKEPTLDCAAIGRALETALAATADKSKAQLGDKTLMDALIPCVEAFAQSAEKGATISAAAEAAAQAAEKGAQGTAQMVAKRGRGLYVGDRGLGVIDPGATSIGLIARVIADQVR